MDPFDWLSEVVSPFPCSACSTWLLYCMFLIGCMWKPTPRPSLCPHCSCFCEVILFVVCIIFFPDHNLLLCLSAPGCHKTEMTCAVKEALVCKCVRVCKCVG